MRDKVQGGVSAGCRHPRRTPVLPLMPAYPAANRFQTMNSGPGRLVWTSWILFLASDKAVDLRPATISLRMSAQLTSCTGAEGNVRSCRPECLRGELHKCSSLWAIPVVSGTLRRVATSVLLELGPEWFTAPKPSRNSSRHNCSRQDELPISTRTLGRRFEPVRLT